MKENIYDDITLYTKEFINSYKYAINEINKDYTLKELLQQPYKQDSKNNIQSKIYKK